MLPAGKGQTRLDVFSPGGGKCEADGFSDPRDPSGYSSNDLISMGFLSTPSLAKLIEDTRPLSALSVDDYDAILVAGGQAPMFTFEKAEGLQQAFVFSTRRARSPRPSATGPRSCATLASRTASP